MLCQALPVFAPLHQGWQLPIQGNAHAALAAALEEEMAVVARAWGERYSQDTAQAHSA